MTKTYQYKTINGVKKRLHTHIMEAHIGRELEKTEHVYHKNGDKNDNDVENLVIIKKKIKNANILE